MEHVPTLKRNEQLPWKIMYQNIRRLITQNNKEKVQFLEEYTKEENILIMNFTETWLDEKAQEDTKIEGYKLYRGDRKRRVGGGTAIYVREEYETEQISELSSDGVEMVAVYIEKLNLINIVIYRPPDACKSNFSEILNSISVILKDMKAPEPTVIVTGDFNFAFVKWKREENGGCTWEEKAEIGTTKQCKIQFEKLNDVIDNFGLIQIIEEPTRKKNTLDLVYTNEVSMIMQVEVTKSTMSDHDRIELTTNIKRGKILTQSIERKEENCLHKMNFNKERIEWDNIKRELGAIHWKEVYKDKDTQTCLEILLETIINLCKKYIPEKTFKSKSIIPKKRKQLFNKMKMLRRSKRKANNRKKDEIDRKILEVEKEILIDKRKERNLREESVVDNMNVKPKLFYDFIKNKAKREQNRPI